MQPFAYRHVYQSTNTLKEYSYLVRHLMEDLVGHDGGDGAANLVVARHVDVVRPRGPQEDVKEPRGHGHLGEVAQGARLA